MVRSSGCRTRVCCRPGGEREEQFALVRRAIDALERRGGSADGQIATTRSAGRTIATVARARGVRYVVMDDREPKGMGRVVQGGVMATVRRRLVSGTVLELVAVPTPR